MRTQRLSSLTLLRQDKVQIIDKLSTSSPLDVTASLSCHILAQFHLLAAHCSPSHHHRSQPSLDWTGLTQTAACVHTVVVSCVWISHYIHSVSLVCLLLHLGAH